MRTEEKPVKKARAKKAVETTPAVVEPTVVVKSDQVATQLPPVEPIIPEVFVKIINDSGINQKKATAYLAKYAPILAEVQALSTNLAGLDGENDEDAAKAKAIALKFGNICSRLADQKKIDKDGVLKLGRFFDSLFNAVNDIARSEQQVAKDKATAKEQRLAAEQLVIETARAEKLAMYYTGQIPGLGSMPDEVFENMLSGFRAQFEADELEKAQKAQAEAEEQEAVRQAAEEAEKEREEEMKRLEELADAKSKEADKVAAELKAEQERASKMAEELRLKREEQEAAEALKLEASNKANQAAEIQKAKPVAEQLVDWLNTAQLPPPPVTNEVTAIILVRFEGFRKWAIDEVEKSKQVITNN